MKNHLTFPVILDYCGGRKVDRLYEQLTSWNPSYQINLLDNASPQNKSKYITHQNSKNSYVGGGIRDCVSLARKAGCKYLLFIVNDLELQTPVYIQYMEDLLESDSHIIQVGTALTFDSLQSPYFPWMRRHTEDTDRIVHHCDLLFSLIRIDFLDEFGGFPPSISGWGYDLEIAYNAKLKNKKIVIVDRFLAKHAGSFTGAQVKRAEMEKVYNKKYGDYRLLWILTPESQVWNSLVDFVCRNQFQDQIDSQITDESEVEVFAVLTYEKPEIFERMLRSYLVNFCTFDRDPGIIIVDDSKTENLLRANEQIVQRLSTEFGTKVSLMNRVSRQAYAADIAEHGNLPMDLVSFALLGHDDFLYPRGAGRNVILLQSAGKMCVQVDDDTFCKIARAPGFSPGINLCSDRIMNELRFFGNNTIPIDLAKDDIDCLALHEELLGKSLSGKLRSIFESGASVNTVDVNKIGDELTQLIHLNDLEIMITTLGFLGDDVSNPFYRFFLQGNSFSALLKNYEMHLNTKSVQKSVSMQTICRPHSCTTMNLGINNQNQMPPFVPVQQKVDSVFTSLVSKMYPFGCHGHLPYAIKHNLSENYALSEDDSLFARADHYGQSNIIMNNLIRSYQLNDPYPNPFYVLKEIGRYLFEIADQKPGPFFEKIKNICQTFVSDELTQIVRVLQDRPDAPKQWQEDMRKLLKLKSTAMLNDSYWVPTDLHGSEKQRCKQLQKLVKMYGRLLSKWPEFIKAATEVNEKRDYTTNHL